YGEAYKHYIDSRKRIFVDQKYNLRKYTEEIVFSGWPYAGGLPEYLENPGAKVIGGGNSVNSAPCVNEGFELNNISGWTSASGINLNSYAYPSTPSPVTFPSTSLTIVQTPT